MEGYTTDKENLHIFRGELALALAVIINSFGVVLMLHSGAGISAISSVPYAFSEVIPKVSLGTWTYIFQGLLDVHKMWIDVLPTDLGWCVLYFAVSYFLLCIGIALSNRCKLPIIPTDLFPRELSEIINVSYSKVKIIFDVTCFAVTAGMTLIFLGRLDGLGIGTVLAAFTMGKTVGIIDNMMDKKFRFVSFLSK